jgi:hypothetical protein
MFLRYVRVFGQMVTHKTVFRVVRGGLCKSPCSSVSCSSSQLEVEVNKLDEV